MGGKSHTCLLHFSKFWNWGRVRIGTIWGQTGSLIKPGERCLGSANYSLIYMRLLWMVLQGDRRMVTLNGQQPNPMPKTTGCPLVLVFLTFLKWCIFLSLFINFSHLLVTFLNYCDAFSPSFFHFIFSFFSLLLSF